MQPLRGQRVIAFIEDGGVWVFKSAHAATLEFEGVDVESGTVKFYDERGHALQAEFTTPNRSGRLFGIFSWVKSGTYKLVSTRQPEGDPFELMLYEAQYLVPGSEITNLEHLKSWVLANRTHANQPSGAAPREV